ncbi:HlyD family type I secretion periplasmic adaptor subunit [Vibrio nomapromontoriensis]|uniref:HlyD family type I secretion periplasmic adaptor subunit n=1 Tax=Vibrio nomapromontoriensis TaxID=2910246 RepID=UPI003D111919
MKIEPHDPLIEHAPKWQQIRHSYPNRPMYLSLWVLLVAIVALITWSCIFKVNTFVVARGHVKPVAQNIVIQSQAEGLLEQYFGSAGTAVSKGDLIAIIGGRPIESDIRSTRYQMQRMKARIRRLEAELANEAYDVDSPPRSSQKLEASLFKARRSAYQATVTAKNVMLTSLDTRLGSMKQEEVVVLKQIELQKKLVADKQRLYQQEKDRFRRTGPKREAYLDAQKQLLEMQRKHTSLVSAMTSLKTEAKNTLSELKRYISQQQVDISDQLVKSTREYIALEQQLSAYLVRRKLAEIHAPIDGVILKVADKTFGSYVAANEFLYEIVPNNSPMEIVVDLNPSDINQVSIGDSVTIKLDSLPFTKYGTMSGSLRQVSEDALTDDVYGKEALTFRGWIDISSLDDIRDAPSDFRLQPGLTLEANIQTDKRTLISYLVFPIAKAFNESFREP